MHPLRRVLGSKSLASSTTKKIIFPTSRRLKLTVNQSRNFSNNFVKLQDAAVSEIVLPKQKEEPLRLKKDHITYMPESSLPEWFQELKNSPEMQQLQEEFEVQWLDEAEMKTFDWNEIAEEEQNDTEEASDALWQFSKLLTGADKNILSGGKDRKYILVGKGIGFPDYRDTPVYFSTFRPSWFWIDPNSSQPKLMYQLNRCMPPLLWIPLKPSVDTLRRVFDELSDIEAHAIGKHLNSFDKVLTESKFKQPDITPKEAHERLLRYLNNIHPSLLGVHDDHPNTCHFFFGNTDDVKMLETAFMNNPFLFNTPILLGSSNKYYSGKPVIHSIFRTVFSRSVITFETRADLHIQFGDQSRTEADKLFPVFVRINYPSNKRLSKPAAARINKIFKTDYPEDMPVDVIAALFGAIMKSSTSLKEELAMYEAEEKKEQAQPPSGDSFDIHAVERQIEKNLATYILAHLAVLRDPDFPTIIEKYQNHPNSLVRLACIKGAAEMGLKDKVLEMQKVEKDSNVQENIKKILDEWSNPDEIMEQALKEQSQSVPTEQQQEETISKEKLKKQIEKNKSLVLEIPDEEEPAQQTPEEKQ